MNKQSATSLTIAIYVCYSNLVAAQTTERAIALDAIIVTAAQTDTRVLPPRLRLSPESLRDRQPSLISDALRGLPGVSLRPNSRGETVARVRGAEERQTAVFFDGAPLSVPWDGRVDLGVLPAGLVNSVQITKGAVPIEYGTNAVAGVVDLQSAVGGEGIDASLAAGSEGARRGSVVWQGGPDAGELSVTLAAGTVQRDAQTIADIDELPFSQRDNQARTNSDLDTRSLFAGIGADAEVIDWRVSLLHVDSERGIAPEAHLDPAIDAPRYWRYPQIRLTQLNVSLRGDWDTTRQDAQAGEWRVVAWRQWFAQRIDAYRNDTYTNLRSREDGDDDTVGARATISRGVGDWTWRGSLSAQSSTHAQIDTQFPAAIAGPRLRYRQELASLGLEADWSLSETVQATFGLGQDAARTPLTGDKPSQPRQSGTTWALAVRAKPVEDWTFSAALGRRQRFPTARELFGEALGRFLINPDLQPERVTLLDLEAAWESQRGRLSINPFWQRSGDTLAQRVVATPTGSLRQRFNLPGSDAWGLDAYAAFELSPQWAIEVGASWLQTSVDKSPTFAFAELPQRPSHELSLAVDWQPWGKTDIRAEMRRTGHTFDIDADGRKRDLGGGTEWALKGQLPIWHMADERALRLTYSIENLTNAVIEPQLGLPLPGRTVWIGLQY